MVRQRVAVLSERSSLLRTALSATPCCVPFDWLYTKHALDG